MLRSKGRQAKKYLVAIAVVAVVIGIAPTYFAWATGLIPPSNPLSNAPQPQICSNIGYDTSQTCSALALQQIDSRRLLEGVPAMQLPSNWYTLTPGEQLYVATNLERIDRGLGPIAGLVDCLDNDALSAAVSSSDPRYNGCLGQASTVASIWALTPSNPLFADYLSMYDDAYGGTSNSFNGDCQSADAAGCWDHRDIILNGDCRSPNAICVEGTGLVVGQEISCSQLILTLPATSTPPLVFSWIRDVEPYLGSTTSGPLSTISSRPPSSSGASYVRANAVISSTADAKGYWLVGQDGGVFAFGDALYEGSVPGMGIRLNDVAGAGSRLLPLFFQSMRSSALFTQPAAHENAGDQSAPKHRRARALQATEGPAK